MEKNTTPIGDQGKPPGFSSREISTKYNAELKTWNIQECYKRKESIAKCALAGMCERYLAHKEDRMIKFEVYWYHAPNLTTETAFIPC